MADHRDDPQSYYWNIWHSHDISWPLSQTDPWQTKFYSLCQDIRDIKANKYYFVNRDKKDRKASPKLNNCKPLPKDKHVKGGLDGIYFEDNKYESPLLNNLNIPTHHDSTLSDTSQVPL